MEQSLPSGGGWNARRVILLTLVVVGVALSFWLLIHFRLVVFSLFEAIVFGTALSPAVDWLQARKISRAVGVSLVFLAILILILLFGYLTIPLLVDQGAHLVSTTTGFYQAFRYSLLTSPSYLIQRLASGLPQGLSAPAAPSPASQGSVFSTAWSYLTLLGSGTFAVASVLLLTFYWVLERDRSIRSLLFLAPTDQREKITNVIASVENRVGAYIRGVAILCLVVGFLAMAAYLAIGVPHALLLGLLAGVFEVVPLVGPILGALPAILVALSADPSKIPWVIVAVVLIQFSENHFLIPRVMNKTVGVSPVVSLLAFAAFSSLFGLAGALLAIPMAVLIQIVLERFFLAPEALIPAAPARRNTVSVLRYEALELAQDVRKMVRVKEGDILDESDDLEDAIESIVTDLDAILAKEEKPGEAGR